MPSPQLLRRLGPFDATMLVMGGIVGAGIFINPAVVARQVGQPSLILGAWIAGGIVALLGAFVYAELASLRPETGGQYAYLRDAIHPSVAFLYGWALLLVVQSGGMAAVAITFARYANELAGSGVRDATVATIALAVLTAINLVGVRAGSHTQSALMLLKIAAIGLLVFAGAALLPAPRPVEARVAHASLGTLVAFGAALTPVMFAYGGWQTASFVSGELKRPGRDLAIGLVAGVGGVIALYLAVNVVCLRALGPEGLAASATPATDVMRLALGERGARLIALGIAISTLGFLSQGMLTAPRVYLAMAQDGVFFRAVARISPRTHVPAVAIAIQGAAAVVIAVSGRYEQILNYVVSVDFIFFGLTGVALLVFRRRARGQPPPDGFRMPGHPVTTALFAACCFAVVAATFWRYPANSAAGLVILAAGIPAYWLWRGARHAS